MGEDGKIVIKTQIDNKGFDDDYKNIQKKIQELAKKDIELGIDINDKNLDKNIIEIKNKLNKMQEKFSQPIEIDGVKITGLTNATNEELDQYNSLQNILSDLYNIKYRHLDIDKQITEKIQEQNQSIQQQSSENSDNISKVSKLSEELEEMVKYYKLMQNQDIVSEQDIEDSNKLKETIIEIAKEIEKLTGKKISIKGITDTDGGNGFENIGNSISKIIKKVGKWTLALFGVRAVYGFIRQAVSQVSSYNDEIAGKLEAIKLIVSTALEPIIKKIVDLIYTGLAYLIPMLNSWFKMDILAEAQANALKKANKNAKGLQKTLSGFDEMNIVNKDGTIGGVGSTIDALKELQEKVNEIQKNASGIDFSNIKFGDTLAILGSIAAIIGVSGGGILGTLGLLVAAPWVIKVAYESVKKLKEEVVESEKSTDKLTKNTEKLSKVQKKSIDDLIEKFQKGEATVEDLKIGIENMKSSIIRNEGAIDSTEKLNSKVGLLEGILTSNKRNYTETIKSMIDKNYENIQSLFDLQKQLNFTGTDINGLSESISKEIQWISNSSIYLDKNSNEYKTNMKRIEILTGYLDILKNSLKNQINALEKDNEKLDESDKKYKKNSEEIKKLKENIDKIDGLKSAATIKVDLDTKEAEKDYSNWLTRAGDKIGDFITGSSKKIKNFFAGLGGGGRSGGGFATGGIIYHNLPRLASGGIINQPGRGVPLTSAIGGERGAEGVLPLTDSQQMELLGQAIGRYITINANITNTMNGRVISRELQKVKNASDFAENK